LNAAVLLDKEPCSLYVNRCVGGMCHLHLQGRKSAKQQTSEQQIARQMCLAAALYPRTWQHSNISPFCSQEL
jgi:hypothetical protein